MPKKTFEAAAEAQAHLIVQLKDNQPTLCGKVEAVCNHTKPLSCTQTVDSKKSNRHETRTVAVFNARPAVAGTEWQPHVAAIIAVERKVPTFRPATGLWDASRETALYLSNRPIRARKAADAVRKHWGIENKQHHTRDVTLHEDASRIRRNPGIFARLRSFAYNILRQSIRHHRPGSLRRCPRRPRSPERYELLLQRALNSPDRTMAPMAPMSGGLFLRKDAPRTQSLHHDRPHDDPGERSHNDIGHKGKR